MKPKLHELLAVENNHETQSKNLLTQLADTFDKKRHLFAEKLTTFIPNEPGLPNKVELSLNINTTIKKELAAIQPYLEKSLNASYQVAETNTVARADVILDDATEPLIANVPATALLELEKRLTDIQTLLKAIPTLDPALGFQPDTQKGEGYYKARDTNKIRTKKVKKVLTLAVATEFHPAQAQAYDADEEIGTIQEQEWSGLITPAEKSDLINRVEIVSRAVRRARSRANEAEVDVNKKIGKALLGYIFGK